MINYYECRPSNAGPLINPFHNGLRMYSFREPSNANASHTSLMRPVNVNGALRFTIEASLFEGLGPEVVIRNLPRSLTVNATGVNEYFEPLVCDSFYPTLSSPSVTVPGLNEYGTPAQPDEAVVSYGTGDIITDDYVVNVSVQPYSSVNWWVQYYWTSRVLYDTGFAWIFDGDPNTTDTYKTQPSYGIAAVQDYINLGMGRAAYEELRSQGYFVSPYGHYTVMRERSVRRTGITVT